MSNFKLTFTLKQHTPLIHFHADQPGATLRASELKPKFDRFLKNLFDKKNIDYKNFLIRNKENAFDYKIKITPIDLKDIPIEYHKKKKERSGRYIPHYTRDNKKVYTTLPTFFANMGEEWKKNPKRLVFNKKINIEIISFNDSLLEEIENSFEEFIFTHNFGTRQSKGFGSFSLEKINNENIKQQEFGDYFFEIDLKENIKIHKKEINQRYVEEPDDYFIEQFELFKKINRFHQTLRSGINEAKFYFKPFIFHYAKRNKIVWDKRTFKEEFLNRFVYEDQKRFHRANYNDPVAFTIKNHGKLLVRDLLGLATEQNWMKPRISARWKDEYGFIIRHPKEKDNISLNKVSRMSSPFIYKPIKVDKFKYKVYIILKDIPSKVFDEEFTILKDKKGVKKSIKMQMWKDFSLKNFFQYIYDNRENVDQYSNTSNHNIYYELRQLFNTLEKVKNQSKALK